MPQTNHRGKTSRRHRDKTQATTVVVATALQTTTTHRLARTLHHPTTLDVCSQPKASKSSRGSASTTLPRLSPPHHQRRLS